MQGCQAVPQTQVCSEWNTIYGGTCPRAQPCNEPRPQEEGRDAPQLNRLPGGGAKPIRWVLQYCKANDAVSEERTAMPFPPWISVWSFVDFVALMFSPASSFHLPLPAAAQQTLGKTPLEKQKEKINATMNNKYWQAPIYVKNRVLTLLYLTAQSRFIRATTIDQIYWYFHPVLVL